tara:strand:- start:293 stop:487 length:195 start_codon:yes stop_codon:yes gene_type:complete
MDNICEKLVVLPNGEYDTLWTGSRMEILISEINNMIVKTIIAVKGINCKQKIIVREGVINMLPN